MKAPPIQPESCQTMAEVRAGVDALDQELVALIDELGLGEGFYQELVPGSDWLPDFCRPNPFSSELSRTIWHHACGFVAKQG